MSLLKAKGEVARMDNDQLATLAIEEKLGLSGAWDEKVPKSLGYEATEWSTAAFSVLSRFNRLRADELPSRPAVSMPLKIRRAFRTKPLREFHLALRTAGDAVDAGTLKPARKDAFLCLEPAP
jgi:hypothetical protein